MTEGGGAQVHIVQKFADIGKNGQGVLSIEELRGISGKTSITLVYRQTSDIPYSIRGEKRGESGQSDHKSRKRKEEFRNGRNVSSRTARKNVFVTSFVEIGRGSSDSNASNGKGDSFWKENELEVLDEKARERALDIDALTDRQFKSYQKAKQNWGGNKDRNFRIEQYISNYSRNTKRTRVGK